MEVGQDQSRSAFYPAIANHARYALLDAAVMINSILLFWGLRKPAQATLTETLETRCLEAQRNYIDEQAAAEKKAAESEQHSAMARMWLAQAKRLHQEAETLEVFE